MVCRHRADLLVGIAIIGILGGILLPAVQQAREAARKTQCKNNLRQIGLALHQFHDKYNSFPNGSYNALKTVMFSAPRMSFTFHLYPYLEQQSVYDAFDFDPEVATLDPNGGRIPYLASVNGMPQGSPCTIPVPTLLCPSDRFGASTSTYRLPNGVSVGTFSHSNYLGFFGDKNQDAAFNGEGKQGAFGVNYGARFGDMKDGASNTMVIGEYLTGVDGAPYDFRGVHWWDLPGSGHIYFRSTPNSSSPDLIFPATWCHNVPTGNLPCAGTSAGEATAASRSLHPGGVHILMGDGAVRFVSDTINLAVWQAMGSIADGGFGFPAAGDRYGHHDGEAQQSRNQPRVVGQAASGTVLVDGRPLPMGSIRFVPVAGTPGPDAGTTITDGTYRVSEGLTEGKYRIEIQGTRTHPTRKVRWPFPTGMISDELQVVPPEYNHESTLICTVAAGENSFDFDLKGFQSKRAGAGK